MNGILYSGLGRKSTRIIRNCLLQRGLEIGIFRARQGRWQPTPNEPFDTLIRWGSLHRAAATTVVNDPRAIALAANKPRAREVLLEQGVAVPPPVSLAQPEFPLVARTANHHAGKGFWLCETSLDLNRARRNGAAYFSRFYPKQREFRVHVGHGTILFVQEKHPRTGEEEKRNLPVWNHSLNDFVFEIMGQSSWQVSILQLAINATKAIGLDFAAVDILAEPKDPTMPPAVVCEINTAPLVDGDYTSSRYADYFQRLLEGTLVHKTPSSLRPGRYALGRSKQHAL